MDDQPGGPADPMRHLFGELEGEFEASLRLEDEQAAVEALRAKLGKTPLWEWLARRVGCRVVVRGGGRQLHGTLVASYVDFCVVQGDGEAAPHHLACFGGGVSIGVPAGQRQDLQAAPTQTAVVYRLALALRELARRRVPVRIGLLDGDEVAGTIEAVGQDFLEVAEHELGEARREALVRGRRLVPVAALAVVSPLPDHQ